MRYPARKFPPRETARHPRRSSLGEGPRGLCMLPRHAYTSVCHRTHRRSPQQRGQGPFPRYGRRRRPAQRGRLDRRDESPDWPDALNRATEVAPAAILVSTYKRVPRSRDAASMLARMQESPVYTVGVLQKDDAFRTMAPAVGVLRNIDELPPPS